MFEVSELQTLWSIHYCGEIVSIMPDVRWRADQTVGWWARVVVAPSSLPSHWVSFTTIPE